MGRSPCCSKVGLNRGVWTSDEDKILTDYIHLHGEGRWRSLPKRAGLKRCGKSCRLRWLNYLRPDIKRGNISDDEEDLIIRLHKLLGNRWSLIAGRLPGRTDNEIKNYWNTSLRKKVHGNHTTSASSPPTKIPTKQNNIKKKKKDKKKHQTTQENVDPIYASVQCTKLLITSPKPDDPKISSTFELEVGNKDGEGKMYPDLTASACRENVLVSTNEPRIEPINNNQLTFNLEPDKGSSDICLNKLLSPDFSRLFGSDFYNNEENNETTSTSPSSSNERSIMEMLEEFWNVENMMIEPDVGSTNLHFATTIQGIGDWQL